MRRTGIADNRRTRMAAVVILFASALACPRAHGEQEQTDLPVNLKGEAIDPLAKVKSPAVVLIFVAVDCPISNRYAPVINSLSKRFGADGVAFWLVYPDRSVSEETIHRHREDYAFTLPALRDPGNFLVQRAQAKVTPQVAVFLPSGDGSSEGRRVYSGRIDDQYVAFGKWRSKPQREDLKEVLEAITDGTALEPRTTNAVGCSIAPDIASGPAG